MSTYIIIHIVCCVLLIPVVAIAVYIMYQNMKSRIEDNYAQAIDTLQRRINRLLKEKAND